MAEITITTNERRRAGFSRRKKCTPKTDMTPLVDLGFLLISFFVLTTELSKPKALHLNMPKGEDRTTHLGESNALTVLPDKNNVIYYYHGNWEDAVKLGQIHQTNLSAPAGIRKVIR